MKTVCEKNKCNGCKACTDICPNKCITINDGINFINAEIDENVCIDCKLCSKVCPNITKVQKKKPIEWKQGWALSEVRDFATSGGAASVIIKSFIQAGGYAASCLFDKGDFVFKLTNNVEDVKKFAGSKYVKSNPTGIYKEIQNKIKSDKVLFIGLPCQVAALKNYVKNHENLYTIDLICHGTPSIKLLNKYLCERGYVLNDIKDIKFRMKTDYGLFVNGDKINLSRVTDHYTCAFLESIDYTENCYECQFASLERVSDMTLGDSLGSECKNQEKNGISLVLVQNEKGKELLSMSKMELREVDLNKAIAHNHQLSHPPVKSSKRDRFFKFIEKGVGFKVTTFMVLPKMLMKQKLKSMLVKLRMMS